VHASSNKSLKMKKRQLTPLVILASVSDAKFSIPFLNHVPKASLSNFLGGVCL